MVTQFQTSRLSRRTLALLGLLLFCSTSLHAAWEWSSSPKNLSNSNQDARIPKVAANQAGQAMAIWTRYNGAFWVVQTALFNGSTWNSAKSISPIDRDAAEPAVAMDGNGNARAVWIASDGINNLVYSARYRNGSWNEPSRTSLPGQDAKSPQIAMDAAGNTVVVWLGFNDFNWEVQGRLLMDGEWQDVISLSALGQQASAPQAVMDTNGVATLVWSQFNGISNVVQSIRHRRGVWGAVTNVSAIEQDTKLPQLAVDSEGNIMVVWMQANGVIFNVQGRRWSSADGWGAISPLSSVSENANTPMITGNRVGSAIAIWTQQNAVGLWTVRSRQFRNGSWGEPWAFADSGQNAYVPGIASDNSGSATAVWSRSNGNELIVRGSHFKNGEWTPSKALSKAGHNAEFQAVAMLGSDRATTVWLRSNGERQVVQAIQGNYDIDRFTLSVSKSGSGSVISEPAGIDCGKNCSARFDDGTDVTLVAAPAEGYSFTGWSGACKGTEPCRVKLTSNKSVSAKFLQSATYSIKVSRTASRGGLVTSSPEGIRCGAKERACTFAFGKDASVTLTATAETGYAFKNWSGCPQPNGPVCNVTLQNPKTTIKPRFAALPKYTLELRKTRDGSVSTTPTGLNCGNNKKSCSAKFVTGTVVTLTAVPVTGKTFTGWGGESCAGSAPTCTLLMDRKKTVRAEFQ